MMDPVVTKALIEIAIFLEFAGEDVVNPDEAVAALEQLAATLNEAEADTRGLLAAQIASMAPNFSGKEDFVEALPETLGLVD